MQHGHVTRGVHQHVYCLERHQHLALDGAAPNSHLKSFIPVALQHLRYTVAYACYGPDGLKETACVTTPAREASTHEEQMRLTAAE